MIFMFLVGSAFFFGAMKGLKQWKAEQVVVNQSSNGWKN